MEMPTPIMTPGPGGRLRLHVGDRVRFGIAAGTGRPPAPGWLAMLRTNLGRAEQLRREITQAHTRGLPLAGASWRDIPMPETAGGWSLELPLVEPGFFKAKPYLVDPQGWQHWPQGADVGISVHPDCYRTGNTIYCAFTRLFGPSRTLKTSPHEERERKLAPLDQEGYTIIPASGKLRDLAQQLPHIFETLGCRILQLLPVNPTPTTYARFGRFGSPYAALDLTAIDPALVVFDMRTTAVDQFRELTCSAHRLGGRVFLDLAINHTGWASRLQENHPDWFVRREDGTFVSPGAWGVTWEDLVELRHQNVALWDELSEVFLTWCRRGVDGFRCDAGYMVPVPAWQYIIARVQQEYPQTLFLLEGLGGAWEATEALLTEGGMQWAYSELFQNYSGQQVASYLDHSLRQSERVGLLIHYSETHDNDRLAARGRLWSLLRNRLCALTSVAGGYALTCGVEWLATEKIRVHGCSGLAWGNADNLLPEISALNGLLAEHPCFFDGARLTRLSAEDSQVYALLRESEEGKDCALLLINTDIDKPQKLVLHAAELKKLQGAAAEVPLESWVDLLGQSAPRIQHSRGDWAITLPPGAAFCLGPAKEPLGLGGERYRQARACAAWAVSALGCVIPSEHMGRWDWRDLADEVERSPARFLARASRLDPSIPYPDLAVKFQELDSEPSYDQVITWTPLDARRITPVPAGHWLLVEDAVPFRASLSFGDGSLDRNAQSIPILDTHVACFPPRETGGPATLLLERYGKGESCLRAGLRYLPRTPTGLRQKPAATDLVLLTNGRGGMARICVDLGRVLSKYDCVLGANLHPSLPVDRHIFAKRMRLWVSADGFIAPLDFRSLEVFDPGPPAVWDFVANAGDGRTVQIRAEAEMLAGRNTTVFRFSRPTVRKAAGKQLPAEADVRLTVRVDIEDRNFHWETHRNGGADYHFATHTHPIAASKSRARAIASTQPEPLAEPFTGFAFTPAHDRQLRVFADGGCYHPQPEWSENVAHPVEQSRGQVPAGDAFSPGWFELPLQPGAAVTLTLTAELPDRSIEVVEAAPKTASPAYEDPFAERLLRAIRAFVVRRDSGKTVIAGYPWFLDWGRDSFICARGLLAAGMIEEVRQLVFTFARFEKDGTLPNTIFGADASNRDTSDAPLWFGLLSEELATAELDDTNLKAPLNQPLDAPASAAALDRITAAYLEQQLRGSSPTVAHYAAPVEGTDRTLLDILTSIARNYIRGTANGIRMDPASGLIWSPSHFTWMDTNYPAGTPREGYPVEIQALWIRLLRQLARIGSSVERAHWEALAARAHSSLERLFWLEPQGYYSDVLLAKSDQPAAEGVRDDALRSNCLFAVSLGLAQSSRAQRCVDAAKKFLVVPGALRSLAPLPVSVPLPIRAPDGHLLNDPKNPYWGRYEGDEDTRRKPAYHNGTAWTWTFPVFCEALAHAWDFSPAALAAARSYLDSMEDLLNTGCLGHVPEILDGDAPHTQRGCDAQAWGATEAFRVWKLLN